MFSIGDRVSGNKAGDRMSIVPDLGLECRATILLQSTTPRSLPWRASWVILVNDTIPDRLLTVVRKLCMLLSFPPETRTLIDNVRWETYVALAEDRRGNVPRITYDRGLMELMSPKKEHEKVKTLLGRLVAAFAEVKEIDIESVASTTFRRQDLDRGFEADESFYITHAETIRAQDEIDLAVDPPPELVIEVEITASAIRKLELFAKLGVTEVWRHDGEQLRVFGLVGEIYQEVFESVALPGFPLPAAQEIVRKRNTVGEIVLVKAFRESIQGS